MEDQTKEQNLSSNRRHSCCLPFLPASMCVIIDSDLTSFLLFSSLLPSPPPSYLPVDRSDRFSHHPCRPWLRHVCLHPTKHPHLDETENANKLPFIDGVSTLLLASLSWQGVSPSTHASTSRHILAILSATLVTRRSSSHDSQPTDGSASRGVERHESLVTSSAGNRTASSGGSRVA